MWYQKTTRKKQNKTTRHLSSVEVRHDFKYSATRNILRIHTWAGRLSLATRLLSRCESDNWRCALCGKINYATDLDQDYLHACHCACFRWFKLPCFVIWVTEKKTALAREEFHFNVNEREMIQNKNTHRWNGNGVEEIGTRASAGGAFLLWIADCLCCLLPL